MTFINKVTPTECDNSLSNIRYGTLAENNQQAWNDARNLTRVQRELILDLQNQLIVATL